MAEERDDSEKTEEPTGRRLDEARKEGNIAQSREVNSLFLLGVFTLSLAIFAPGAVIQLANFLRLFLEQPDRVHLDSGTIQALAWQSFRAIGLIAIVPIVLAVFAAVGAGYIQFGLIWSGKQLAPDLSRLSPLSGLKRIVSRRSLAEFIKGLLKITVVGIACYWAIAPNQAQVQHSLILSPEALLLLTWHFSLRLMIAALIIIAVIAALDFLYQRFDYLQKLRLSRQELKEELKETEGNPLIKARLRQLRQERARRRMMAAVPKADVIITNPSHYAIALKYDGNKMNAPEMVAKGTDLIAQKIKELAQKHEIPIIENPPLARGLYASIEIGMEVPPEFYKAVAEIIAFVFKLRKNRRF